MPWSRKFEEPIVAPDRTVLTTLRDAVGLFGKDGAQVRTAHAGGHYGRGDADYLVFTGSPAATNSFDLGNNSGITIIGPGGGGGGGGGEQFSATIF